MPKCKHKKFHVENTVNRLTNEEGRVTDFMLDTKVSCKDCGCPFEFVGLEQGVSFAKPMVSATGTEGRFPIREVKDGQW